MNLSERKKKILSAVVDESLKTAEPVSSKDLQEKYIQDLSSATIRNELMALEEMGFLSQPHTSAGRIPTPEGYKKYINELMPIKKLSKKEADSIKASFEEKFYSMDAILNKAAKTISDATNYASMVYYGITDEAIVEKIGLIKLTDTQTLIIVATDLGLIKQETNSIQATEEELKGASKILSNAFYGKTLRDIDNNSILLTKELTRYQDIFNLIIDIITSREDDFDKNIAISGKEKLLDYPEYHDIEKLKKTFSLLDKKEELYPLLCSNNGDFEISFKIGGDEKLGITDCSIVTATYKSKGKPIGSAGVVGPVRMDYGKVVSILKNVTQILENNLFDE